jgi:GntR family transcriptional repressor for pyruvate dehydrogenase complex
MLGLLMQSKKVNLREVGEALKRIEPICTSLCAERADRATAGLPKLLALQEASIECIETDVLTFTNLGRQFHEAIVAACGNHTMIQLVGALEECGRRTKNSGQ